MRDGDIIADGKPVGLVCLSVYYKNVGTFAPQQAAMPVAGFLYTGLTSDAASRVPWSVEV
jgi:hypothetical protein